MLVSSASGILFALSAELPLLPLAPPAPTFGTHDIIDYYVRYGEVLRTNQLVGCFGAMFFLVFLAGLRVHLQRLQCTPSLLTLVAITAGVVAATMSLTANAASLSIVVNAGQVQETAAIELLHDFANATDVLTSLPLAIVVGCASAILVHRKHASRWIGLAGFPVAALLTFRVLALGGGPALPFPPLYPAWFEALAISMVVRQHPAIDGGSGQRYNQPDG